MTTLKWTRVGLATVAAVAGLIAIAYWLRGSRKPITTTAITGPGDETSDQLGPDERDAFTIW